MWFEDPSHEVWSLKASTQDTGKMAQTIMNTQTMTLSVVTTDRAYKCYGIEVIYSRERGMTDVLDGRGICEGSPGAHK